MSNGCCIDQTLALGIAGSWDVRTSLLQNIAENIKHEKGIICQDQTSVNVRVFMLGREKGREIVGRSLVSYLQMLYYLHKQT